MAYDYLYGGEYDPDNEELDYSRDDGEEGYDYLQAGEEPRVSSEARGKFDALPERFQNLPLMGSADREGEYPEALPSDLRNAPGRNVGSDFHRGALAYGESAARALAHPFSSPKQQAKLEQRGRDAEQQREWEPAAFQVGREAPPFLVPGVGARRLGAQVVEAAGTAAGLSWLDFDRNASGGDLLGDAAGAAAVPAALRGVAKLPGVSSLLGGFSPERVNSGSPEGRLRQAGIELSPAEKTGSRGAKTKENIFQRKPGGRSAFQDMKDRNTLELNKVAARAIGAPPGTDSITESVLGRANTRIKATLDSVVDSAQLRYDAPFREQIMDLRAQTKQNEGKRVMGRRPEEQEVFKKVLDETAQGRPISGRDYQDFEELLSQEIRSASTSGQNDVARMYSGIRDALDDMMDRQLGGTELKRYRDAKRQYANLQTLQGEKVANVIADGNVDPKKVARSLNLNKNFRKKGARGEQTTDLDLFRDYVNVENPLPALPITSNQGISSLAAWAVPKASWDAHAAKAYLAPRGGAQDLSGQTGTYLGGRLGGSQMTEALFDAVIKGSRPQDGEEAGADTSPNFFDLLQQLNQPRY